MRVLLAHNRYRFAGGEEKHVDLLASSLLDLGLSVSRLDIASSNIVQTLRGRTRAALEMTYRRAGGRLVADALTAEPADLVHFHNITPLLSPAALRSARRAGAAVVLTLANFRFACPAGTLMRNGRFHDDCLEGSSLRCGLRNSRGRWSESLAYGISIAVQRRLGLLTRWVDAFICPSRFVAEQAVRSGLPAERIHVIHNGVRIGDSERKPEDFALYAGRLSVEKGVETLLDAAAEAGPVVIAGDGPLRRRVEAGVNGRVRYVGHVDEATLASLRVRARYSIVPSTGPDVFPFAALESLADGVPVIASRVGGLPEIVDHGTSGLLVPPGDALALAEAMRHLNGETRRVHEMGLAARVLASERFDVAKQAAATIDLYRSLL